jgi:hypothetical protein
MIVGGIVSILLEVVPRLKDMWSGWEWRRLTLLGLSLGVPLGAWGLVCLAGVTLPFEVACGGQGAFDAAVLGIISFLSGQTTYLVKSRGLPNSLARKPSQ